MTGTPSVLVVGGGLAATAAAFSAARAGSRVQVMLGGVGASQLGSGALDDSWPPRFEPDHVRANDATQLAGVAAFIEALDLYDVGPHQSCVATLAGRLRTAAGRDRALLDLAGLAPGRVLLPRVDRPAWDAEALCRGYQEHAWAAAQELRFEPCELPMLHLSHERSLSDRDFAALFDEPERIAWMTRLMADHLTLGDVSAVLVGPWLGTQPSTVGRLRAGLAIAIGETLSSPGGIAGLRFERARDRLLASSGVDRMDDVVVSLTRLGQNPVEPATGRWVGRTRSDQAVEADTVILATGGLLGGGIELESLDAVADLATHAKRAPGFVGGFGLPGVVGRHGRPIEPTSSVFGLVGEAIDPSTRAGREAWLRTGLLCDAEGRALDAAGRAIDGLFAAGDVVADRPRSALAAIEAGLTAGQGASTEAGSRR